MYYTCVTFQRVWPYLSLSKNSGCDTVRLLLLIGLALCEPEGWPWMLGQMRMVDGSDIVLSCRQSGVCLYTPTLYIRYAVLLTFCWHVKSMFTTSSLPDRDALVGLGMQPELDRQRHQALVWSH
jgi:hypothetical protein